MALSAGRERTTNNLDMTPLTVMMLTNNRGAAALVRGALAADLTLDGARALRFRAHLGASRADELLPPGLVAAAGYAELACAVLLFVGLLTRVGAAPALALALASAAAAYRRVGGLSTPESLDTLSHGVLAAAAAAFLLAEGGGRWSLDSLLTSGKRGRRRPR